MIRPLRRLHRAAVAALAIVLPVAFGLAIGARPPAPTVAALPGPLGGEGAGPAPGEPVLESNDLFSRLPVELRLWAAPGRTPRIELRVSGEPGVPALLAYWSAAPVAGSALPEDAVLLGALAARVPRTFELPVAGARGHVLLYSLGHGEVVDRAELPPVAGRAGGAP